MAIPSTMVWEVEVAGSDTANGGGFDPSNASMATDGAATVATGNSPVFTSASYNFVAGDVGAWLFIKSGTNWLPGWYKIASVASNAATLSAAVGVSVGTGYLASTVAGCATTASPTAATWAVDYSQQAATIALTTLTTAAANAIILTASATKAMVGNAIQITAGTNFTVGIYAITAVSAGVSITVDRNCTTAAGAAGTAGVGGALGSPGKSFSAGVTGNLVFVSGSFTITSGPSNLAGGTLSVTSRSLYGYNAQRSDGGKATLTVASSGVTSVTMVQLNNCKVANIIVDGNAKTSICGFNDNFNGGVILLNCEAKNCTNIGFNVAGSPSTLTACSAHSCTDRGFGLGSTVGAIFCESYDNTAHGFVAGMAINCLAYRNGTGDGFHNLQFAVNCTAYANGATGFTTTTAVNCLSTNNGTFGFQSCTTINGATFANTSGAVGSPVSIFSSVSPLALSGSPFVNVSASTGGAANFGLNSTAGAGLACQGVVTPGLMPSGSSNSYEDLGALQHNGAGAAATTGAPLVTSGNWAYAG